MGSAGICYDEKKYIFQEALTIHNYYRKIHNSPLLEINSKLNKMANLYLDNLINSVKSYSTNIYNNEPLGENILICNYEKTPKEICINWYNEESNYKYNLESFQKGTNHFTQMIWKSSKEFGFAYKFQNNRTYGVALYYPSGNKFGEFQKNVGKKKYENFDHN